MKCVEIKDCVLDSKWWMYWFYKALCCSFHYLIQGLLQVVLIANKKNNWKFLVTIVSSSKFYETCQNHDNIDDLSLNCFKYLLLFKKV